jgi:hypothetical protein
MPAHQQGGSRVLTVMAARGRQENKRRSRVRCFIFRVDL